MNDKITESKDSLLRSGVRNSLYNLCGWFVPALTFLAITPYIVSKLGLDGFGVLTLTTVLTGYMSFLNLGMGPAITRHVSSHLSLGEWRELGEVIGTSAFIFLGVGIVGSVIVYFISPWLVYDLFNIPNVLEADALFAFRLTAIGFFLQMVIAYLRGMSIGYSRFEITNVSKIIRIVLSSGLIIFVLYAGFGLRAVMIAIIIGMGVSALINWIWIFSVPPKCHVRFAPHRVKELFSFGIHIFIRRTASLIASKSGQIALGSLSAVANVSFFEIPARVVQTGAEALNRLMEVMFPISSGLFSTAQSERLKVLFLRVFRFQLLISLPTLLVFLLEGRFLLHIWLGETFANKGAVVLSILGMAYFLSSLTNLPSYIALGCGRPRICAAFSVIQLIVVLVLIIPLTRKYGLMGISLVILAGQVPALLFVKYVSNKVIGLSIWHTIGRELFFHGSISLVTVLFIWYLGTFLGLVSFFRLVLILFIYTIYWGLSFISGLIHEEDVRTIKKIFAILGKIHE